MIALKVWRVMHGNQEEKKETKQKGCCLSMKWPPK